MTGCSSPASYQRKSCSKSRGRGLGIETRRRAVRHTDDGDRLQQDQIEPDARDVAGGEPDHEIAPVPREAAQVLAEVGTADGIEDHIDAASARELLDALRQAFLAIVDDGVGATLLGDRELLRATGGGDHVRAHRLRHLDRRRAGSSGGSEHEHALPRLQLATAKAEDGGAVREVERRGLVPPHRVGNAEHLIGARGFAITSLANAPIPVIARTRSPTAKPSTSAPTSSNVPEHS